MLLQTVWEKLGFLTWMSWQIVRVCIQIRLCTLVEFLWATCQTQFRNCSQATLDLEFENKILAKCSLMLGPLWAWL